MNEAPGRKHAPRLSAVCDRNARVPAAADPSGRRRLRTQCHRWPSTRESGREFRNRTLRSNALRAAPRWLLPLGSAGRSVGSV